MIMKIQYAIKFHGRALFRKPDTVDAIAVGTLEEDVKTGDKVRVKTDKWSVDSVIAGIECFWKNLSEAKKGENVAILMVGLPEMPYDGTVYAQELEKS